MLCVNIKCQSLVDKCNRAFFSKLFRDNLEMEVDESVEPNPKCFKCDQSVTRPLNIVYNATSSTFLLWNKYEIYLYENLIFSSATKVFVPDFLIHQLISSNNFIVCLDLSGNIHTIPMKFKSATQKRMKTNFLSRVQCVLGCTLYTADKVLCLTFEQEECFLNLHSLNAEFEVEKKVKLTNIEDSELHKTSQNTIIRCHTIPIEHYENITEIFNLNQNVWKDYSLILISFDKRIVYGCIFSLKSPVDDLPLVKLLTSPSKICDMNVIELDNLCIVVSLTSGTLIRIILAADSRTTDVVHLNTAISKCVVTKDAIIYTDGLTMWKSENTFNENIKFQQFIVKQLKDFQCFADQILCTTFTNLIYLLTYDSEASYDKPSKDEYCEVRKVLTESGYLHKIMEQIDKNKELEDKINKESNHITALSLSNRPDILNNIVKYSVFVYENYRDAVKEKIEIIMTDDIKEYFETNLFFLLIKIQLTKEKHKISNMLLEVFKDLQVHITLISAHKVLKTTSLKIFELKNINILIPLTRKIVDSNINVHIKIIKGIPGALNTEHVLWNILHNKDIVLNAEHFIKTKDTKQNIIQLKVPEHSLEELIHQIALSCNGHLFKFVNISNQKCLDHWSFFVNLPDNYVEALQNDFFYKEIFNQDKAMYLQRESTTEGFIKTENNITFEIGNDKVNVEIINDGFSNNNVLKVSSKNMKIGFDIRNFYSNLVHKNLKNYEPEKEFVRYTLYTTIENFQKTVRRFIMERHDKENMKEILEQFQRDVFGAIPI